VKKVSDSSLGCTCFRSLSREATILFDFPSAKEPRQGHFNVFYRKHVANVNEPSAVIPKCYSMKRRFEVRINSKRCCHLSNKIRSCWRCDVVLSTRKVINFLIEGLAFLPIRSPCSVSFLHQTKFAAIHYPAYVFDSLDFEVSMLTKRQVDEMTRHLFQRWLRLP
jgi:hypothetical protein